MMELDSNTKRHCVTKKFEVKAVAVIHQKVAIANSEMKFADSAVMLRISFNGPYIFVRMMSVHHGDFG